MQTIGPPPGFSHDRRRFLGVAALSLAAMQLGPIGPAKAQCGPAEPARPAAIRPGRNTSFSALKQIDAGPLNVGYAEAGPADGPPVLLLHGGPSDIHSYVDVPPIPPGAGDRVIVPYLRGYGTTRFLSADTIRNGQQSVVAVDAIALMDALRIEKAVIGGFAWGARTGTTLAVRAGGRAATRVEHGLFDRKPRSRQAAAAAAGRIAVVVPVRFRHRSRPGG